MSIRVPITSWKTGHLCMIQAAYPKMEPPKIVLQSYISEHEILVIAYSKQWSPEIKNCWSQLCQNLLFVFLAHGVY